MLGELVQEDSTVALVAGGDVMLGSWAQQVVLDSGFAYPFVRLLPQLSQADIVFANLEAPFGDSGEALVEKSYTFQVMPALAAALVAGKINLVSLANNHIMDFGISHLKKTVQLLDSLGIQHAGAGVNRIEACREAALEVKGIRLALVAYSLTFPQEFWATDTSAGTCFPWAPEVFEQVRSLRRRYDVVMVSCHWGQELMELPKKYQIELAHRLIDAGADIILGHHPHVVQGIEVYQGRLIAYSLGNFVFGSYSEKAREGLLLKVVWSKNGMEWAQVMPINVYNAEREFQPVLLNGERRTAFLQHLNQISLELNNQHRVITSDGRVRFNPKFQQYPEESKQTDYQQEG